MQLQLRVSQCVVYHLRKGVRSGCYRRPFSTMPIEDVQYLLDHSALDSQLVFIDSSRRNRQFHPTPAEYTVEFPSPLRMVTGIEILDGAVPSAAYNVDERSNTMLLMLFSRIGVGETVNSLSKLLSMFPRRIAPYVDSVLPHHILILSSAQLEEATTALGDVESWPAPVETTLGGGGIPFSYVVLVRRKQTAVAIDEKNVVDPNGYVSFTAPPASNGAVAYLAGRRCLTPVGTEVASFLGSTDDVDFVMEHVNDNVFMFTWFEEIPTTDSGIRSVRETLDPNILADIRYVHVNVTPGNYTLDRLQTELQNQLSEFDIEVAAPTGDVPEVQFRFKFVSPVPFVLNMHVSTLRTVLGYDEYASPSEKKLYHRVVLRDNPSVFGSVRAMGDFQHSITSPGIIALTGDRYVTLRCREIESHLSTGNDIGEHSTGIGVFKLAGQNEVTHVRFDFVNLIRKPFHPIGKLTRLSLRFERSNGELYNFRSTNHQILLVIKFLAPVASVGSRVKYGGSVLNPAYDPNYLSYLNRLARTSEHRHVSRDMEMPRDDTYDYSTDEDATTCSVSSSPASDSGMSRMSSSSGATTT